jgi:hypothetical protein
MSSRSASFPEPAVGTPSLGVRPYQTDFLDDTLLGLMAIASDYHDPRRDILSAAFGPLPWSAKRTALGVPDGCDP